MFGFWDYTKDISVVNRLIFPIPKPPSYNDLSFPDELIFVPKRENLKKNFENCYGKPRWEKPQLPKCKPPQLGGGEKGLKKEQQKSQTQEQTKKRTGKARYCDEDSIPCLYLRRKHKISHPTHILLYCHGNAEDLGKVYPMLDYLRIKLPVSVLAPEYPGYGIAKGTPHENSVIDAVLGAYEFIISPLGLNVSTERVLVYGFSIGCGAALGAVAKITSKEIEAIVKGTAYGKDEHRHNGKHKDKSKDKDKGKDKDKVKNKDRNISHTTATTITTNATATECMGTSHVYVDAATSESATNGQLQQLSNAKDEGSSSSSSSSSSNSSISSGNATDSNNLSSNTKEEKSKDDPSLRLPSFHSKRRRNHKEDEMKKAKGEKEKKENEEEEEEEDNNDDDNNDDNNNDDDNNGSSGGGDPFAKLPLRQVVSILHKADIEIPKRSNKEELLALARTHDLIPSLKCCLDSNTIPKYSLLVLVSPFSSIAKIVADKVGTWASYLLSDRFDNLERIKRIHGPLLLIHGSDDSLIPCQHSQILHKQAKRFDIVTDLHIMEKCDHNTMDLRKIVHHIKHFFAWQFEAARKKDKLARLHEITATTANPADDRQSDTYVVKLKGHGATDEYEQKHNTANDLDTQHVVATHGVVNSPNCVFTEVGKIRIPAYAYLRPHPDGQVLEHAKNRFV
ncbi:hypothetical protein RFI_14064 [Reticulomyxa filosa]|uniref:Peptidase S9 prolyl oligopeptidase catalytic domain-containing protein n=1 Tax=Reticulomyxa filosa TaxID=46433 RepID=X6NAQ3_RETFI|nr:hypothetical protein RFI_14064 [Reticulomyxa filosa]|eukprot:ETO23121.1 hypothetical protein RFI_14064 [Reticulomyxa filosa]